MQNITIVGAGLAGSLLSVYLAKKGFNVNVYERRPDMRKTGISAGKSINLALSARGINALKEVGLYDEIKKISIPMYGRRIHTIDGSTNLQPYGRDLSEYINSVSRSELNKKLMDLAENFPSVKIHFNMRCINMDLAKDELYFYNEAQNTEHHISSPVTISADGAASAVRMEMMKTPRFDFKQEYENYGYKELHIPPNNDGTFKMDTNALHIWPRGSFMLIALPNMDGSFTCTLFLAYDKSFAGENSFEFLNDKSKVQQFFEKNFPDTISLMPALLEDFFANPTGTLITIKCFPWSIEGKMLMLGDASHAIVPFFGQGMNAAFEDCSVLNKCIDNHPAEWNKIFSEFQTLRKPNTDAIAELAQENFIEMRDLVAEPSYLLKKKIEAKLYSIYPDTFVPKYSMVTFLRMPYSTALKRGKIQEEILEELSKEKLSPENIDLKQADKLIKAKLPKLDL